MGEVAALAACSEVTRDCGTDAASVALDAAGDSAAEAPGAQALAKRGRANAAALAPPTPPLAARKGAVEERGLGPPLRGAAPAPRVTWPLLPGRAASEGTSIGACGLQRDDRCEGFKQAQTG